MNIYSEKSRIKSYHVDRDGKLSTVQVFNFLQEAAFRHSVIGKFGQPDLDELGLVWVLSRMKVEFYTEALLGEEVEINSWVRSINGALSERDFEIFKNGTLLIRATSLWVCLDMKSLKPTRIPPVICDKMVVLNSDSVSLSTAKIPSLQGVVPSSTYVVQPSDIDMVNHTNNVVYLRIIMDRLNAKSKVKKINLNYLNQSFEGDELAITRNKKEEVNLFEITNSIGVQICKILVVLE